MHVGNTIVECVSLTIGLLGLARAEIAAESVRCPARSYIRQIDPSAPLPLHYWSVGCNMPHSSMRQVISSAQRLYHLRVSVNQALKDSVQIWTPREHIPMPTRCQHVALPLGKLLLHVPLAC